MKAKLFILCVLALTVASSVVAVNPRRRVTPVTTGATTTQSVNETASDTSRINAKRRQNSISYVDDRGRTMYVDTITGTEWTDSTLISVVPKMEYPLWHALTVGVNLWDPLMRAFGQKFGGADAWVELSLHNRYKPVFEFGIGTAKNTPSGMNFTYTSPASVYFRIGANYNFLFNSNPDYSVYAGVRYGFAPFSYSVTDVTLNDSYWGETSKFNIPSQHVTASWGEVIFGIRVKIKGPVSAGWSVKYHSILHESKNPYGKPWYIPGYGSRNGAITASFSISYTFGLERMNKIPAADVIDDMPAGTPSVPADSVPDSLSVGASRLPAGLEEPVNTEE